MSGEDGKEDGVYGNIPQDTSGDELYRPIDVHITCVCGFCGREERFRSNHVGQAWLTGHILEEHEDELPELEGTGEGGRCPKSVHGKQCYKEKGHNGPCSRSSSLNEERFGQ